MKAYLESTRYVDSDHPEVISFSERNSPGKNNLERAVSLYYAVRDGIRYNPFLDFSKDVSFQASHCLVVGEGFCIGKAALLAACARVAGVPARVGFADVRNHLTTPALRARMGSDLFVYHGFTELWLEEKWVKATPAFNVELCRRFNVKPLEFDGREDSIFHPFDADERRHMEYVGYRGSHADVPVAEIMREFRERYPGLYGLGGDAARERFG